MLAVRLTILPIALTLGGFISFERFDDAETGISLEPPGGYIVFDLPRPEQSTALFLVVVAPSSTTDILNPAYPYCVLGLHRRNDNAALTQTELDRRIRDPNWLAETADVFVERYALLSNEAIELDDRPGHQFILADRGALAGTHQNPTHVMSFFDLRLGRISLTCETTDENLTTDLVTFDLIRNAITLP